jgi:aryl-alcohol dehydrogenase-like predicted oxidoreductase
MIPTRAFGKTGVQVTQLGLGGEGILRTYDRPKEAAAVIERALARGIRYFDTAPAYAGSLDYYGATLGERRQDLFLASKTASRSRDGSLRILDESLARLRTNHLDLWQLHDLRTQTDLKQIFGPNGAIHALDAARAAGRIRFAGLTGHHRPDILLQAMCEYPFDSVLIPLNPADGVRLPFRAVLEEARRRGMAVIAMKVLSAGLLIETGVCSAQDALSYVWSLPGVSVAIVGCTTPEEVEQNVRTAQGFRPLSLSAQRRLEANCAFAGLTPYKK